MRKVGTRELKKNTRPKKGHIVCIIKHTHKQLLCSLLSPCTAQVQFNPPTSKMLVEWHWHIFAKTDVLFLKSVIKFNKIFCFHHIFWFFSFCNDFYDFSNSYNAATNSWHNQEKHSSKQLTALTTWQNIKSITALWINFIK